MKKFVPMGMMCFLVCIAACTAEIADDVYHQELPPQTEKNSSLTIDVLNTGDRTDLVVGILEETLFDGQGKAREISDADLLLSAAVTGGKAEFPDLMDYYKSTLFFNVFTTAGDVLEPLTNAGSQLQYQVVFGDISKTIDLSLQAPETVHVTDISVSAAAEYSGKTIYLTDEAGSGRLKEAILSGEDVPEDLYIASAQSGDEPVVFRINSPRKQEKYCLYIVAPEDGLDYLVREVEIDYGTESVPVEFAKEEPKRITVTATYLEGDSEPYTQTPLHNKEVYLISSDAWTDVRDHVDDDKGNPEPGTFVSRSTLVQGNAVFEVFCTEGRQDYVVYVPKWNTDYYDSYQYREVSVTPDADEYPVEISALFTPPGSGGDVGITKTVTFTVKITAYPDGWRAMGPIYAVADSEYLKELYEYSMNSFGGTPPDVNFTKSDDISYSPLPIEETLELEINTAKEIAFFVTGMQGWIPAPVVARVNGSEITGNTYEVTLTDIEYL